MTAEPLRSVFVTSEEVLDIDHFKLVRSDWIDSFARFEAMVIRCCAAFACDPGAKNPPLKQRLISLGSAKPSERLSGANAKHLERFAHKCDRELKIRATVVHGIIKYGSVDGRSAALFQNALDIASDNSDHLVMTHSDFSESTARLKKLTDELDRYLLNKPEPRARPLPSDC